MKEIDLYVNKYECITDQELPHTAAVCALARCSTFLCEMTSWPPSGKYDIISELLFVFTLKNNPAKFHPDPI